MPQAAIPIAAEAAVASTLTAAEIAAAQAAAAELAAAQAAAAQAAAAQTVAATNASVLSAIAPTAAPAATTATTAAGTGVGTGTGVGGIVDLGTSPEVLQQLQAVKGPLELGNAAANTYTGPGSMSNFGELVNPFETLPPAAPPVVPSAPPVVPSAPPAAPPAPPAAPPAPPAAPPAPHAEQLVESAVSNPVKPQGFDTNVGFDVGGFETRDGIDILAKEVGAQTPNMQGMQGMQTMTSGYGAGAPTSTLPTSFNPAAPMANPTYAQSGLQGLQTNLSGPLGSNLPPSSVTQAVTSAGTGLPPASQDIGKTVLENYQTQQLYPNASVSESVFDPRVSQAQGLTAKTATTGFELNQTNPANPLRAGVQQGVKAPPNAFTYSGPELGTEKLGYALDSTIDPTAFSANAPTPEAGGIQSLFNQGLDYAKKNPLTTAMFANTAYNYLNQPKPYEKEKYKSTFKPGLYTGYQPVQPTPYQPNYAHGGLADLGGYSDGGRMLKGPGDGMSDDIPATIANKQPARLANEEFVVPADVVSHLGNGSSEAGAKVLYKMMDRVRQARTGNKKQGKQINPEKYLA